MDIGPIRPIRSLPVAKTPPPNPELSGVFDIENFARIGDETYTPSVVRSAGGHEDEFDDPADSTGPEDAELDDPGFAGPGHASTAPLQSLDAAPNSRIDFFA